MWIKMLTNYLAVITAMLTLTLSHCSFTVKKTPETVQLNLDDVDAFMSSNECLTNVTHFANKTIVKRQAYGVPGAPGLPLAFVPSTLYNGPEAGEVIQLYEYRFPMLRAAVIGPQTFSCRQDTGQLAVAERVPGTRRVIIRMRNAEFFVHPNPGTWWFIKCLGMESGGSNLDVTGVQKPGGDSGIDPNALKSLVG